MRASFLRSASLSLGAACMAVTLQAQAPASPQMQAPVAPQAQAPIAPQAQAPASPQAQPAATSDKTADEVVAMNIKARFPDKWRTIQTVKVTGTITIQGQTATTTAWQKRPNEIRQELVIRGVTLVQAFDGTTAWAINPQMFNGSTDPHPIPASQAATIKGQAEFESPLFDYKTKGVTVGMVGKERLDGLDVYHLQVTEPGGQVQQFYISATTGLEKRIVTRVDNGVQPIDLTTEPSNYRAVDGITMPFSVTQSVPGLPPVQLSVKTIEFNVPIDESVFRMPKAGTTPPAPRAGRRP